MPKLGEAN